MRGDTLLYEPLDLSPRDPDVQRDLQKYFRGHIPGTMPHYHVLGPGLLSETITPPTRDAMIESAMSIGNWIPHKGPPSWMEGPTFWTREQAERAVDAAIGCEELVSQGALDE